MLAQPLADWVEFWPIELRAWAYTTMQQVLMTCRAGFESDLAAEIQQRAAAVGVFGFVRAKAEQGYVVFECQESEGGRLLLERLQFKALIFARQWLVVTDHLQNVSMNDRISPIYGSLQGNDCCDIWLSFPDTNEGKSLSRLTRKLEKPLARACADLINQKARWHAHVFFVDGTEMYVGLSPVKNAADWPLGFPRLRQPPAAPSRSALKLEEAWLQMIPEAQRATMLKPFQKAVDLGAAPGGWTWQLVEKGLQVTAVDNGPMDRKLMESGQVTHLREDAFSFRPTRPVDWLVCDMVEKPARVAELMERWLGQRWARYAIFNLKLPMKRRWLEVSQILERMQAELAESGVNYELQAKQLYHDREEITVFAAPRVNY